MQEKRGQDQNLSIRSPQAPSTLKVYDCCPRARPAQVTVTSGGRRAEGGRRARAAGIREHSKVIEQLCWKLWNGVGQSGQCSIELPTRLELTTIAVNTPLHLERLLDL